MREAAVQSRPGHVPTAGRAGVRLRTRLVPAVALVALMGLLAGGLTVAAGAAAGTPFLSSTPGPDPPWLSGPLHGLGLALRPRGYALALVGMSVSYAVVLAWPEAVGPRRLATVIAALHLLFALAPPIVTPDVFSYVAYARVGALHHSSPYLSPPNAISGDPVVALVAFRELPSPYGPLWTLASYPLASLGLAAAVWLLKGVTAAAGLGCVALVAGIAGRLGRSPARAAALVGLNPIVLVYGVGGAHNDLLVMLLVLAGLHFGLGRREALGASVVTAAAAVKLSAGLALPFLVLGARRRWVALAAAVATAALCAAVAIATFGAASGAGLVAALRTQQSLVSEASVPWLVGWAVGHGGAGPGVRWVATAAFVALLSGVLWRAARGMPCVEGVGWATLALLLTTTWLMPYYLVWLMPLAALGSPRLRTAALGLFAFVALTRIGLVLAGP